MIDRILWADAYSKRRGAMPGKRKGSCCLFLALEPNRGRRRLEVRERRTAVAATAQRLGEGAEPERGEGGVAVYPGEGPGEVPEVLP